MEAQRAHDVASDGPADAMMPGATGGGDSIDAQTPTEENSGATGMMSMVQLAMMHCNAIQTRSLHQGHRVWLRTAVRISLHNTASAPCSVVGLTRELSAAEPYEACERRVRGV